MAENKVTVTVNGKVYNILSDDSREHVLKTAQYADDKITELREGNNDLPEKMLLMLALLNIADENITLKEKMEAAADEIKEMRDMLKKINAGERVRSESRYSDKKDRGF